MSQKMPSGTRSFNLISFYASALKSSVAMGTNPRTLHGTKNNKHNINIRNTIEVSLSASHLCQ
jgi:hypothetical protein